MPLSLAKTLEALSFTPLTMLQACAQAVDFKVGHHFGEGQGPGTDFSGNRSYSAAHLLFQREHGDHSDPNGMNDRSPPHASLRVNLA
jgi:hypothetical protein